MKDYWNNLLTEKSWNLLLDLKKKNFNFILIGGWAAYLWTKLHKSKDVDIVICDYKDLDFLKKGYNLNKNDNLKKYEIKFAEIDLDIYIPHYSKLAIPVEDLKDYTTKIENFDVIIPEILLILKQGAEIERKDSVKGEKDRIDIMAILFFTEINFNEYFKLLKKYKIENFLIRLKQIINNFKEVEYLNLNPREFKIKKQEILNKLKR